MRILHLYFWSVEINGQVGQGGEDSGDSQGYLGFDGSPDD